MRRTSGERLMCQMQRFKGNVVPKGVHCWTITEAQEQLL